MAVLILLPPLNPGNHVNLIPSDGLYRIWNRPHGPSRACFTSSDALVSRYDVQGSAKVRVKVWPS